MVGKNTDLANKKASAKNNKDIISLSIAFILGIIIIGLIAFVSYKLLNNQDKVVLKVGNENITNNQLTDYYEQGKKINLNETKTKQTVIDYYKYKQSLQKVDLRLPDVWTKEIDDTKGGEVNKMVKYLDIIDRLAMIADRPLNKATLYYRVYGNKLLPSKDRSNDIVKKARQTLLDGGTTDEAKSIVDINQTGTGSIDDYFSPDGHRVAKDGVVLARGTEVPFEKIAAYFKNDCTKPGICRIENIDPTEYDLGVVFFADYKGKLEQLDQKKINELSDVIDSVKVVEYDN